MISLIPKLQCYLVLFVCFQCPYGRKNVPEEKRRKKFNSAFYI